MSRAFNCPLCGQCITDEKPCGCGARPGLKLSGKTCEWFLLCDRPAVVFVMHPIIGPVPTCQRCKDWYERQSASGKEVGHGGKA